MNERTVYALGFFDGVHLGHRVLLSACREMADELGCSAGVVTFGAHPDALVRGTAPGLINTARDRDSMLREKFHMDTVLTLPFDRKMRECPWHDFFQKLLQEHGAAGLVCGEDFRFGYRGEGNSEKLLRACREAGIPCVVVPQLTLDDVPVSSTHIRNLIEMGMMDEAVRFLGHPHQLTGKTIRNPLLSRILGQPVVNLMLPNELVVPRFGVYAGRCLLDGVSYPMVANVGTNPTLVEIGISMEFWVLGYPGDLAGRQVTLEIFSFLRPELRFPSLTALRRAVEDDAKKTKEIFRTFPPNAWE